MWLQVLAKQNGLNWRTVRRLADLQSQLNLTLNDCIGLVEQRLTKPVYTKQEICDILGISDDELDAASLSERSRHGQFWLRICCSVFPNNYTTLHPFNILFSRTAWVSRYRKGKTSLKLNETRDDGDLGCNGISWTICKQSASHARQIISLTHKFPHKCWLV